MAPGARAARAVALAAAVCCAALAAGAGRGSQGPSAAEVEAGAQLFQQHCAFCHGADARGGRGPDLIRSALVAHDVEGDIIGPVIRNGRPDQGLPAQNLSGAQLKAIAAFLHDRARRALESSSLPKNYDVQKLLTGNAAAGRAYFEGAGGCAQCHSAGGDLKGVASRLAPLDLEAKMLYPGNAASTVTVTLPGGQQVQGSLEHLDEFTVALRDSSGWYHAYSRDRVQVKVHDPLAAHRQLLNTITQDEFHNLFAYLETLK